MSKQIIQAMEQNLKSRQLLRELRNVPFSFLNPRWWRVKKKLNASINKTNHIIKEISQQKKGQKHYCEDGCRCRCHNLPEDLRLEHMCICPKPELFQQETKFSGTDGSKTTSLSGTGSAGKGGVGDDGNLLEK